MNNYFADYYIRSGMTMATISGSIRINPPIMTVATDLRLVLAQILQIDKASVTAIQAYRVDKLELIGIAKHETPVAYEINRHSPFAASARFENPPVAATNIRPLTDYEKSALVEIKGGKETVGKEDDSGLTVVGAVRSQDACLQCHTGKVGDVLGAFSYHLSKVDFFNNGLSEPASAGGATSQSTP